MSAPDNNKHPLDEKEETGTKKTKQPKLDDKANDDDDGLPAAGIAYKFPDKKHLSFTANPKKIIKGTYTIYFVHNQAEDHLEQHTVSSSGENTIQITAKTKRKLQGSVAVDNEDSMLEFSYLMEEDLEEPLEDETALQFRITTLGDDHMAEVEFLKDDCNDIIVQVLATRVACPWIPDERDYDMEDYQDKEVQPIQFQTVEEAEELVKQFKNANAVMASTRNNCPALFFQPGDLFLTQKLGQFGDSLTYYVARKAATS